MKKLIIFSIIIICTVLGILKYNVATTPCNINFEEFYPNDISRISKIEICDGSTGEDRYITNRAEIYDFVDFFKQLKFGKMKEQNDSVGWSFSITFFEKDKEIFKSVLIGKKIFSINRIRYEVNVSVYERIECFYNNIR
ncbi:hypothetical protein [Abyssisolibacter fermentans]|uniref:hypothetical protein n=1 Tax=Abyssisolibacter fermentans TaxID=1766203 RepID=UPI00082F6BB0|nr:hypothetical protein [Abyssisolibacter fermentans]